MLRLSIDELEDEDVEGEGESLPFVAGQEVVDQYGINFAVSMDENGMPVVAVLQN